MDDICEMTAIDRCLSSKSVLQLCVLVLPVSRLLHLKAEVTTCVGNVIETFIVVRVVNIVQLVFDIYIYTHTYIYICVYIYI